MSRYRAVMADLRYGFDCFLPAFTKWFGIGAGLGLGLVAADKIGKLVLT